MRKKVREFLNKLSTSFCNEIENEDDEITGVIISSTHLSISVSTKKGKEYSIDVVENIKEKKDVNRN